MTPHIYRCPLRWGDMDAQGHVNNGAYVDFLQEARVDFLLRGPVVGQQLLDSGVLVVSHQLEYLKPIVYGFDPVEIRLWVDAVGGSRFTVGYELYDGAELAARARTGLVPYDLATNTLRRLNAEERAVLTEQLTPAEPLRSLAPTRIGDHDHHRWPLKVRWSDLDSYGHANNVKYFDYIQEGRVAMMGPIFPWTPEELWVVVRQDVEYRRPIDFRTAPYEVATVVSELGNRSFTLAAEIRDPQDGTTYASGRTVIVRPKPLTDEQRFALSAFATPR